MLILAGKLSNTLFYFEMRLNEPPDFHCSSSLSVSDQLGSCEMKMYPIIYHDMMCNLEHSSIKFPTLSWRKMSAMFIRSTFIKVDILSDRDRPAAFSSFQSLCQSAAHCSFIFTGQTWQLYPSPPFILGKKAIMHVLQNVKWLFELPSHSNAIHNCCRDVTRTWFSSVISSSHTSVLSCDCVLSSRAEIPVRLCLHSLVILSHLCQLSQACFFSLTQLRTTETQTLVTEMFRGGVCVTSCPVYPVSSFLWPR